MFSVIIPTSNSYATLAACLDSILNQSFKNFEILIVDGVSTDATIDVIKKYGKTNSNIRWVSERDNGIYDAMNKGIKLATGEWVIFLGADDQFHDSNVLEKVHKHLAGKVVVYGNSKIIGNTSWAEDGDIYDGPFDLKKLLTKNICHQSIFYNLSYIKKNIGFFNVDYNVCSDWDFNLRCWAQKPMHYIDFVITDFYGGGVSTKKNSDEKFSKDFKQNIIKYFPLKVIRRQLAPDQLQKLEIKSKRAKWIDLKERLKISAFQVF